MTKWFVQCLDLEEGSGALWHDVSRHDTESQARTYARTLRQLNDGSDESLCRFRVAEYGTRAYYSQPTDKLEY
jgi:hypothetical protein